MCWFGGAVATFCVIGYLLAMVSGFGVITFIDAPNDILQSLGRLPYSGKFKKEFTVPPTADQDDPTAVEVKIWGFELRKIEMLSDQRLLVSTEPISSNPSAAEARRLIDVAAGDERTQYFRRTTGDEVFPTQRAPVEKLYVRNVSRSAPADITLWWETEPIYPEAKIIPRVALYVLALFVFCLLCTAAMPKIAAISLSTFKNEISQPIFVLLSVLGLVFILVSIYMPYYTLGEDIKMYKEGVLTFIRVLAIFLAVWSASKSVAEEIEGRTALTVLSKPVGRRQFIVGKFGGIGLAVGFLFVILGLWFVIWVSYKPIYDGVETSVGDVEWQNGFQEAMRVIPGLWLGYMEVLIFVAISVAISTRLGILPNFLICFAIYVMGHLTPLIVQSNELARAFEPVQLFGRVIATVIPVLDHFDIQAAIMGERAVPLDYVGWCIVYSLAYGAMALLFALVLFEDRDLA
jgi:ABC-type transport system involved in multi-copper enzyme maturation permease subunit